MKIKNVLVLSAVLVGVISTSALAEGRTYNHSVGYSTSRGSSESLGEDDDFGLGFNKSEGFSESFLMPDTSVRVSGEATIVAKPDVASVNFEVISDSDEAGDSLSKASENVEKLIDALKDSGVDKECINTVSTRVYPNYDYDTPESNKITGYTSRIILSVTEQEVDDIGEVIATAMQNGANSVNSLNFFCSDFDDIYNKALANAVENARDKAEAIADASHMEIICMGEISEGYQDTVYKYSSKSMENDRMNAFAADESVDWSVPIQNENAEITATVSIEFICR